MDRTSPDPDDGLIDREKDGFDGSKRHPQVVTFLVEIPEAARDVSAICEMP